MSKQTKKNTFPNKLTDPFTIITILGLINYIIVLALYFSMPLVATYDLDQEIQTNYSWNGYFETYGFNNSTVMLNGKSDAFPFETSRLLQAGLILMICTNLIQISAIFLMKDMTRKKFIRVFSWPNFIFNFLILTAVLLFTFWPLGTLGEDDLVEVFTPIRYGLFISLLILILTLGLVIFISQIEKTEEKIAV
ncbi:MAG TPA: hypothetical protein VMX55_12615 [candidate division Zixibacteria bacterium]|nr:hypothetical protein [candidate division Zixibacteria bacterium]